MNVLVDPIVLALPDVADGRDALDQFISGFVEWRDEIVDRRHEFLTSMCCIQALHDAGCYLDVHTLRSLMAELDISEYDARDVDRVFRGIVSNMPFFEERVEIPDMLVDPDMVCATPDLPGRLLTRSVPRPAVAIALRETLAYAAYAKEVSQHPVSDDLLVLSAPLATPLPDVRVEATVHLHDGDQPLTIDIPLVADRGDLLIREEWKDIWHVTDRALDRAQEILVREHRIEAGRKRFSYSVAPEFNESIKRYGYHSRPDVLEQIFWAAADLLTESDIPRDTASDHVLRLKDVNFKDAINREWTPRRRQVRGGSEAIRLHYWWTDKHFIITDVIAKNAPVTITPLPISAHKYGR